MIALRQMDSYTDDKVSLFLSHSSEKAANKGIKKGVEKGVERGGKQRVPFKPNSKHFNKRAVSEDRAALTVSQ